MEEKISFRTKVCKNSICNKLIEGKFKWCSIFWIVNQKIERPGNWAEFAFELCRDGLKISKAKIITIDEFKRSLDQVFKCHPYPTQQAKFAHSLEHTAGSAHDIVAMCKGHEKCFDKAWDLIANGQLPLPAAHDKTFTDSDRRYSQECLFLLRVTPRFRELTINLESVNRRPTRVGFCDHL